MQNNCERNKLIKSDTALTINESSLNMDSQTDRTNYQRIHAQPGRSDGSRAHESKIVTRMAMTIHESVANPKGSEVKSGTGNKLLKPWCLDGPSWQSTNPLSIWMVGRFAQTINESNLNLECRTTDRTDDQQMHSQPGKSDGPR